MRRWVHAKWWTLALTFTVVAGCSNGGDGTASSPSVSDSARPTASATPEKRGKITVSVYDRGTIAAEEGTAINNRWTKWINENGPVDVEFVAVPRNESKQKFNVLFASGSAPDLIMEFDTNYRNQLIGQKQLMPIGDLIDKYSVEYKAMLQKNPILRKMATREDGNMYEFGRLNGVRTSLVEYVRKDWLDALGLDVPKTVDELYKVAEAFVKQDPDRNGKDDTLAMDVTFVGGFNLNSMFQDVGYKVQNGTIVRTWENKIARNNFVKKLYDNGLIDKDFLTDKNGEKAKQDFISGKIGFYGANGGGNAGGYTVVEALKKNNPKAEIIAIELPATQLGQFSPAIGNPAQATAAINANAKDPVAVIKFVDFLVKQSTMMTLNYGLEGVHYKAVPNSCPVILDADKKKKELDWNIDMRMLVSTTAFGECGTYKSTLNPNNLFDMGFKKIVEQSDTAYLNPARPIAEITHPEHMPSLPSDLQLIVTNTSAQMESYYQQALIGGSKYSVEQSVKDAQAYWEKSGGLKVDQWYADWYAKNKGSAILAKDLY
ncbi:extracellular solute-binding protein [Paenibacillus koleovorans]|uniref:extracellular solute-binding protein n=1 Tax=Paenibacillus koleovorans TaxID=121608 RepID=UPI000FD8E924|nr:extracellular solute-binding protein [Paenibacillus koleovorans]